jgi:hypothetical protein
LILLTVGFPEGEMREDRQRKDEVCLFLRRRINMEQ